MKLNLKKVNTKKELEEQGNCRIDLNKGYWDYDSNDKYVLVADYGLYFQTGGEMFGSTPVSTIKEAINIYNNGIYNTNSKIELSNV